MLKLENFRHLSDQDCELLSFMIKVECNDNLEFAMEVRDDGDAYPVIYSNVPQEYAFYERQARAALMEYAGKELPDYITSAWY